MFQDKRIHTQNLSFAILSYPAHILAESRPGHDYGLATKKTNTPPPPQTGGPGFFLLDFTCLSSSLSDP